MRGLLKRGDSKEKKDNIKDNISQVNDMAKEIWLSRKKP